MKPKVASMIQRITETGPKPPSVGSDNHNTLPKKFKRLLCYKEYKSGPVIYKKGISTLTTSNRDLKS